MYTNDYYDLSYDRAKNQINWKVKGFWKSAQEVPDMEKHWDSIFAQAKKPGYNILGDVTEMKPPPQDVQDLHQKVQAKIVQLGVHKLAVIVGSALTDMTVKHIGKKSGLTQMTRNFADKASGQAWLNER